MERQEITMRDALADWLGMLAHKARTGCVAWPATIAGKEKMINFVAGNEHFQIACLASWDRVSWGANLHRFRLD